MIELHRTEVDLQIRGAPEQLLLALCYTRRVRPNRYELRKRDYKPRFERIPTFVGGDDSMVRTAPCLLEYVVDWCKRNAMPYKLTGIGRVARPKNLEVPDELRPYQQDALRKLVARGYGRAELPTGSGKTHIILALYRAYAKPTLILVPSRDLLMQTVEFFNVRHIDVGVAGAGYYSPQPTTISTYKSASQLDIPKFKVIILDEAHHAGAKGVVEIFREVRTLHRFGLSGTLEGRHDSSELLMESMLGPARYTAPYQELQDQGYLAKFECFFVINRVDDSLCMLREYTSLEKKAIVQGTDRNKLVIDMANAVTDEHQLMISCRRHAHMDFLQSQIPGAVVAHGRLKGSARKKLLADVMSGKIRKIVTTPVYTEGINIPELSVIINAAGGKGRIPTLQRAGRGSRVTADKNTCTYVDFLDIHHGILERQSKQRMTMLRKLGHSVQQIDGPDALPFWPDE